MSLPSNRTSPEPPIVRRRGRYLVWLVVLLVALLLASNLTSVVLYLTVRNQLDAELGARLISIANTTARAIGEVRVRLLSTADPDSGLLESTRSELREIAAANDLDNIVIVDADQRSLLDLRASVPHRARHPLLDLEPALIGTLVSGLPQATGLVQVEGLAGQYLKTGFAAIESREGDILGAVAVEGGSEFFSVLPAMRSRVVASAAVGLSLIVILGWFFFRILRSLVRLEDSLRQNTALLAIGQISAIVAHEIKNPLAIIRSRAERVRAKIESGKDPEEVLSWFRAIPVEVDRLDHILSNYLSLARPDASGRTQVAPVVADTLTLVGPELQKRGIEIALDASLGETSSGGPLELPLGPRSLKQILLNLLLNASQAIEGPGRIEIAGRLRSRTVELEIRDTGRGMTEEEKRRACEPFYSTRATGSGLGLTLVSSLVQASGGSLRIESTAGTGTTITLVLPRREGEET